MSTPLLLEVAPEIDTNPTSFYRGGVEGGRSASRPPLAMSVDPTYFDLATPRRLSVHLLSYMEMIFYSYTAPTVSQLQKLLTNFESVLDQLDMAINSTVRKVVASVLVRGITIHMLFCVHYPVS